MGSDQIRQREDEMKKFVVNVPPDFEERIYAVTPNEIYFCGVEVVTLIKILQKESLTKPMNAQQIWAGCIAVIARMLKGKYPHSQILAAINTTPKYFEILMPNQWISNGAKMLFEHEMAALKQYVSQ